MAEDHAFRVTTSSALGKTILVVAGNIDEHADLSQLGNPSGLVEVDMGRVRRINSYGVRSWIEVMRRVPSDVEVVYTHCPPFLVDQMNMVDGLIGDARVASFFVPLACEDCGAERSELVEVTSCSKEWLPQMSCPGCGSPMVLDDIEDKYRFLLEHVG